MKNQFFKLFPVIVLLVGVIAAADIAHAAGSGARDTEKLAKDSQNPISSLISLPFENNIHFNNGPENATTYLLNVKPVYPVRFSENWNLVNRVIMPFIYQDERFPGEGSRGGIGDTTYQGFFSPSKGGKLIWGIGPSVLIPTGSGDRMSSDKWAAGPSFVGLTMPGHWVIGALVSNIWSFAGEGDAENVNSFSLQYFINYNMKGGWYLSSAPTITANWEADSGNKWTVPFGISVGRVFNIGKQPVNIKAGGLYNVEKPDPASEWTLQAQITLLFPK